MYMRVFGLGLLAAGMLTAIGGCSKSAPADAEAKKTSDHESVADLAAPTSPPVETVARLHWLGKKRLATETNASYFMSLWNLPESSTLESQTLDKLALAPWRLSGIPQDSATNQPAASGSLPVATNTVSNSGLRPPNSTLLRPLLEDLVQEEIYLEIRNATNAPGELALAVKLDDSRAALWATNLGAALEFLTGTRPTPAPDASFGWSLTLAPGISRLTHHVSLTRSGPWTLFGLDFQVTGPDDTTNSAVAALLSELAARSAPPPTNYWVELMFDLPRVASALGCRWHAPVTLPKVSLAIIGDGRDVRARGSLDFQQPIPLVLDDWMFPTNLIHDPLISFTAMRGFGAFLSSWKPSEDLQVGRSPNQVYFWALDGLPFLSFFAAPLENASDCLSTASQILVPDLNAWLATNGTGQITNPTNSSCLIWKDLPIITPSVQVAATPAYQYLLGGIIAEADGGRPLPNELLGQVFGDPNLVCYDWEITGPRIEQWLYFAQLFRYCLGLAQLESKSPAVVWMRALEFKLGNSATVFRKTSPTQISFVRKSSLGLTAMELHLLADWLESPKFPLGLRTFLASPGPKPTKRQGTPQGGQTNGLPTKS